LKKEFHVAYVYIKMANSPRPGVWALEKSVDYGQTFQPWQYFADTPTDCYNFFKSSNNKTIENDDDVICTTE
jgi:laminin alpha 3/5